jgi:hypothetical protein
MQQVSARARATHAPDEDALVHVHRLSAHVVLPQLDDDAVAVARSHHGVADAAEAQRLGDCKRCGAPCRSSVLVRKSNLRVW